MIFEASVTLSNQYVRRDTLIISGEDIPNSSPEKNCRATAIEKFHEKLHLQLTLEIFQTKIITNRIEEASLSNCAAVI